MAQLKDTQINGNLNVSGDVQIGNMDVMSKFDEVNANLNTLNAFVNNIAFMTGTFSSSGEDSFLLARVNDFLNTGKPHAFVYVIYDGNDYYTGTLSRYGTSSAMGLLTKSTTNTIIRVKSNGSTLTKTVIS